MLWPVATCGGFAAATAVCMVSCGVAASTTAYTIAAAFIGSADAYSAAVFSAASCSDSIDEYCSQGDWDTVISTASGAFTGTFDGYTIAANSQKNTANNSGRGSQNAKVKEALRKGQDMHKQMDYGPGVVKEKRLHLVVEWMVLI